MSYVQAGHILNNFGTVDFSHDALGFYLHTCSAFLQCDYWRYFNYLIMHYNIASRNTTEGGTDIQFLNHNYHDGFSISVEVSLVSVFSLGTLCVLSGGSLVPFL